MAEVVVERKDELSKIEEILEPPAPYAIRDPLFKIEFAITRKICPSTRPTTNE